MKKLFLLGFISLLTSQTFAKDPTCYHQCRGPSDHNQSSCYQQYDLSKLVFKSVGKMRFASLDIPLKGTHADKTASVVVVVQIQSSNQHLFAC